MHPLDLSSARPGAVQLGAACVVEMQMAEEDLVRLELESLAGRARAHAPAGMIRRAGVATGSDVLVIGRLEWEGDEMSFAVDLIRPVRTADGISRASLFDQWAEETLVVELTPPLRSYLLWLLCGDLAHWTRARRTKLSREEARSFALYLHDTLAPDARTALPPVPEESAKRRGRAA